VNALRWEKVRTRPDHVRAFERDARRALRKASRASRIAERTFAAMEYVERRDAREALEAKRKAVPR